MHLSAREEVPLPITIEDGNGRRVSNCISIETTTGEGTAYLDLTKPQEWPHEWHFGSFVGGSLMTVQAKWKTPIRVFASESGVEVTSELELFIVTQFNSLGHRLKMMSERHKAQMDNGFIYLWAELGKAKAGIL